MTPLQRIRRESEYGHDPKTRKQKVSLPVPYTPIFAFSGAPALLAWGHAELQPMHLPREVSRISIHP